MQHEILFRGKRLDNGKWVYGYFVKSEHDLYHAYIITSAFWETDVDGDTDMISTEMYHVDPNTVGQYTGLTDKNGVKVFNGDIVHIINPTTNGNFQVKFGMGQFFVGINMPFTYVRHDCEAIGNIHDNPELLEVRNDDTRDY